LHFVAPIEAILLLNIAVQHVGHYFAGLLVCKIPMRHAPPGAEDKFSRLKLDRAKQSETSNKKLRQAGAGTPMRTPHRSGYSQFSDGLCSRI
jgi:hypothetical protein